MARCSVCGRSGLMLRLDRDGECLECARKVADDKLKINPSRKLSVCYDAGGLKGGGIWATELRVDANAGKFALSIQNPKEGPYVRYRTYDFSELMYVGIEEDGSDIIKGTVSGALAGGIIAGGLGALIGSYMGSYTRHRITLFDIVIEIDDVNCPRITIPVIRQSVFNDSQYFKKRIEEVSELYDVLNFIADSGFIHARVQEKKPSVHEVLSGIKELKELLDSGAITKEEYTKSKRDLLGMLKAKPDEDDY